MAMNDLLSDMLTRIRNGQRAHLARVQGPYSGLLANVLEVLKREGYIRDYVKMDSDGKKFISIDLKYHEGKAVIRSIKRSSKPGRRLYSGVESLKPVHNGLGISVVSTSKGVLSDHEARQRT